MKKHKLFDNFDDNRLGGKINRLVIATKEGDNLRWGKVAFVLFVFLAALYAVGILGGETTPIFENLKSERFHSCCNIVNI